MLAKTLMTTQRDRSQAPFMEHRCGQRIPLNLAVRLWGSTGPVHVARLSDISPSGAFLRLAVPMGALTGVHVDLKWPTALSRGSVRLKGCVTRRARDGVGVEWDDFAPQEVMTILREFSRQRSEVQRKGDPLSSPWDEAGSF